jgi:uncharacterized protein (TIGR02246 family)
VKSRTELEDLTESLARAWNAHDAAALCAFYAADADFVDVTGAITQGREAIFARHQAWFRTVFSRSSLAMNAIKVRFITPGTAAMHAVWSIRGAEERSGWMPVRTGMMLFIFARRAGKWQVVLSHTVAIPAAIPP